MTDTPCLPTKASPASVVADRNRRRLLGTILLVSVLTRLAAIAAWPENLHDDRDGYLALSAGLAKGQGFSVPGTNTPTAFRPPLYPLALMPGQIFGNNGFLSDAYVGLFHIGLGLITVWLTWTLAARLTALTCPMSSAVGYVPQIAASLVAVDPILVRYATLPMTETLATCLVTAFLLSITPPEGLGRDPTSFRWGPSLTAGVLFGLAALCRPTVWAFAGLIGLWTVVRGRLIRLPNDHARQQSLNGWILAIGVAVTVVPWGLRNQFQFGQPILMTTHGGYTLLLGNNAGFYREVVHQPWGTVWDGSHGGGQSAWVASINAELEAAGVTTEVARDRWMRDRAWSTIREQPADFVRACWLRLRRFWGIVPVEAAAPQPAVVRWSVGTFYLSVLLGFGVGVVVALRNRFFVWIAPLLMIGSFMGVHLLYWTNARMRAPVVPVIAMFAALGWCRLVRRESTLAGDTDGS